MVFDLAYTLGGLVNLLIDDTTIGTMFMKDLLSHHFNFNPKFAYLRCHYELYLVSALNYM